MRLPDPVADAAIELRRLLDGHRAVTAIQAAIRLGVIDLLDQEASTCDEMARRLGVDDAMLLRLLRALAALGVLSIDPAEARPDAERFMIGRLGHGLRADVPDSLRGWAELTGRDEMVAAWRSLDAAIRGGKPGFEVSHGCDVWTWRQRHPEAGAEFDRAMAALSAGIALRLLERISFDGVRRVADVGGGSGTLLTALLMVRPGLTGVLIEGADVARRARESLARRVDVAIMARLDVVDGDFFEPISAVADVYLLKFVLHDWNDAAAGAILASCRQAMATSARLVIIERILGISGDPLVDVDCRLADLHMLAVTGGRERSLPEFDCLLAHAGLHRTGLHALRHDLWCIEAVKRDIHV